MTEHCRAVAIVTGASRGIGRAIAEHLAGDNYATVVNFLQNETAANQTVDAIIGRGGVAVAFQADVSRREDRQRLLDRTLELFGRIDVLVNNAGITSIGRQDVLDLAEENFQQVMATNLLGPFFLAQRVARWMVDATTKGTISRGIIINISSLSAYTVSTNRADYCMAKAAMSMMTRILATRLAQHAIRVYEVCPGIIASDMTAPVKEKYDRLIAGGLTPIARWGTPDDVGRVVRMLVREEFDFCTGMAIHVDGGFHIRRL